MVSATGTPSEPATMTTDAELDVEDAVFSILIRTAIAKEWTNINKYWVSRDCGFWGRNRAELWRAFVNYIHANRQSEFRFLNDDPDTLWFTSHLDS